MKCEVILGDELEEKVCIYAKEESRLVREIKNLVENFSVSFTGYKGTEIIKLSPSDIYCLTVIDNKIYAICEKERFLLKKRLYETEKDLTEDFIKINQSCIANVNKIACFDAAISGTLKIRFKNGYTDYVSRRQLKKVKERLGL